MRKVVVYFVALLLGASQPPTLSRPSAGAIITDPSFGGRIIRISSPTQGTVCTHQYSTWGPFNADNTRLLMMCFDDLNGTNPTDWVVNLNADGTPASYVEITGLALGLSTGVEWDRTDPDVIYHLKSGAKIYAYDLGLASDTLIKDLTGTTPNATRLQMSNDGDYFSMGKQDAEFVSTGILVWKKSTDSILVNLARADVGYKPELSTDGAFVIAFENGSAEDCYVKVSDASYACYTANVNDRPSGHGDVGDSIFMHWDNWESKIIKHTALTASTWSEVFDFGYFGFSFHGSLTLTTPNKMIVGTSRACPIGGTYPDYSNELFSVPVDGSAITQYAHSRANPCTGSSTNYWQTIRPAWSWNGRFVAYTSNWYPDTDWETVADLFIIDTQPASVTAPTNGIGGRVTLGGRVGLQ